MDCVRVLTQRGTDTCERFKLRRERMWAALALAVVSFITLVTDGT